jgi:hypothetical protein
MLRFPLCKNAGDLSDSSSGCFETDELPGKPKSPVLRKPKGIAAKKGYPKDNQSRSESSHVGNTNGDAAKLMDDNQIEMQSEFIVGELALAQYNSCTIMML